MVLELKVAVTERAELSTKLQVFPEAESQPDQPENTEPDAGLAVSDTEVPPARVTEQVLPQLIPLPLTVPAPLPDLATLRV